MTRITAKQLRTLAADIEQFRDTIDYEDIPSMLDEGIEVSEGWDEVMPAHHRVIFADSIARDITDPVRDGVVVAAPDNRSPDDGPWSQAAIIYAAPPTPSPPFLCASEARALAEALLAIPGVADAE